MNEATHTWADSWASSQQALLRTLFPVPAQDARNADGADSAAAAKGVLEAQFAELRDTWKESMEKWTALASQEPAAGALTPEQLRALFTPSRWSGSGTGAFGAALRHVLEGPKYATLFDLDRQLLVLRQLATQRDRDVAAFQSVMQKGWNTAFERFATDWQSSKTKTPPSWRGMADRWLGVVNDTFIEVHRSEAFIEAQRKMLRSASDYRLQERKIAEAWCEAFHIPTRTEMDEMQKTVTELRRQLRSIQHESGQGTIQPARQAAAPASRRGRASKPRAPART